ncbi:MAG: GAF domain-containing protein [Gammaproteobacteria bacterium]
MVGINNCYTPSPENEETRLQALHALNILDTPLDLRFECITQFAALNLEVPICLVILIDANRQWFKSAWGVEASEMPRDISICAHAICDVTSHRAMDRIYEITDTKEDSRFFDHPLVQGEPWVRSYISNVLQSEAGLNIGTLCLVDTRPRRFDEDEKNLVIELGSMAENLIHRRHVRAGMEHLLH